MSKLKLKRATTNALDATGKHLQIVYCAENKHVTIQAGDQLIALIHGVAECPFLICPGDHDNDNQATPTTLN